MMRPGHRMCNWAPRESANGVARIPSYAQYLAPRLRSSPWMPDVAGSRAILEGWANDSRRVKSKLAPQELPDQPCCLYRWNFLMADETRSAIRPIGGLRAQRNLLNIIVTESVNLGLSYFRIMSARLRERSLGCATFPRSGSHVLSGRGNWA